MKKGIHPEYYPDAKVICSCGNTFTVGSTQKMIRTDVCSACHPFFTGEQRLVDAGGQVERFIRRLEKREEIRGEEQARLRTEEEEAEAKEKADKKPKAAKQKARKPAAEKKTASKAPREKSAKKAAKKPSTEKPKKAPKKASPESAE